jgi:hypothetical protein
MQRLNANKHDEHDTYLYENPSKHSTPVPEGNSILGLFVMVTITLAQKLRIKSR